MSAVRVARAATRRDAHHQVRRLLSRPRRRVSRAGGIGRADARHADQPRRHGRRVGRHARRVLQRSRVGAAALRRASATRSPRSSSSRSPATWASCRRRTDSCAGCATSCTAHGALLIFDEVISGFRAAPGGAQALAGVRPGSHVPRQDHRRRPAGRRVRRPRGSDGARLAGGPGVSGGHAVGKSAGDDGRHLVPRSADAAALPRPRRARHAARRRPRRRGARGGRRAAGQRGRIGAHAVLHRSARARLRVGDEREHGSVRAILSEGCSRAASIRRRRSSRRGSCRRRTRRRTWTRRSRRRRPRCGRQCRREGSAASATARASGARSS